MQCREEPTANPLVVGPDASGSCSAVESIGCLNTPAQLNSDSTDLLHRAPIGYEEYMSKETNSHDDYKKHKFLDLSKPLVPQIWNGGFTKEFYLDQVYRPRRYQGGGSAPLFGNFLEPFTKTPWWLIPTMWLPCIAYGTNLASEGLSIPVLATCLVSGVFLWTLLEYGFHRSLFHIDE